MTGGALYRSVRGLFSKGFLLQIGMQQQQTECISVSWNIAIVAVLTDFTNMAVMLSDLLRNLTFNRSAHCTQVSDQCPLGLLFLVHLSRRLKCTIVITRCPSSVVNFSHFWLLLWNRWTEFNETWQEARSQRPLPNLCFLDRLEKQDGRPGLWLAETFSTSPLKPLNGIQRNLTGSKISTSSSKFVFLGRSEKQDGRPGLWLAETFLDFSSETAEWNSTKFDRKQDLNVFYQVCVLQADRKNKMATLASDWLRLFLLLLWNR